MSLSQPDARDSPSSPGMPLNLSSNNPFRNRAFVSQEAPPRPSSRNPFLDASPPSNAAPLNGDMSSAQKAADIFDNLTLNDKPGPSNGLRPARANIGDKLPPPYSAIPSSSRGENVRPKQSSGHRTTHSQEEELRARKPDFGSSSRPGPSADLDIFADPSPKKSSSRRPRRNSESSVMEKSGKLLDPEDEKKREERRRRERRHAERSKDGRSKKPDRKLDVIDKLDVTSIYGSGLFHHDGPFDACNPHRNRQGSKRAPMQAFPKDSLNNSLGGSGPVNKRPDHATFLGHNDEEAFKDYSKGGVGHNVYESYEPARPQPRGTNGQVLSATTRVEPIHGEESLGLGTSTFLEGAPASRTAMQRTESETTTPTEGGLSRKKSLAQKIRGVNPRRDPNRVVSPGMMSPETPTYTPGGSNVEANPFFNEYSKANDGKTQTVTIAEPDRPGRARAPSSPQRGFGARLERRVTSDGSSGGEQQSAKPNGFLSRVKSLKGGPRKPRNREQE